MRKEKQIQIPENLMLDILKYHICGIKEPEIEKRIQDGLNAKLAAMQARQDYQENLIRMRKEQNSKNTYNKKTFQDAEQIAKEKKQSTHTSFYNVSRRSNTN